MSGLKRINIKFDKNVIFLSAVVLLSLLIRTLIANYRYVINNDELKYLMIAKNLAMGRGFSFDGITPHLLFSPLYPFFSALVFYCFRNMELASKLNYIFCGGLVCVPLYYLAAEIYNRRVARLSAIIMIFLPCWLLSQHFWSAASEQLYTFLFISGVLFFYLAIFQGPFQNQIKKEDIRYPGFSDNIYYYLRTLFALFES